MYNPKPSFNNDQHYQIKHYLSENCQNYCHTRTRLKQAYPTAIENDAHTQKGAKSLRVDDRGNYGKIVKFRIHFQSLSFGTQVPMRCTMENTKRMEPNELAEADF